MSQHGGTLKISQSQKDCANPFPHEVLRIGRFIEAEVARLWKKGGWRGYRVMDAVLIWKNEKVPETIMMGAQNVLNATDASS